MTKNRRRASSRDRQDGSYLIGYRRPPVASRFQRGASGNPKGRPKNSKNLKTLIRQHMTASISVQEGTKTRQVSKIEGVVLRQLQSALKGDERAAMAVLKMAMQLGILDDTTNSPVEAQGLTAADEQILEQLFLRDQKARRR